MSYLRRLKDMFHEELKTTGLMTQDREEGLVNFATTPLYVEKVLFFGTLVCLDSFLYVLTFLPLRSLISVYYLLTTGKSTINRRGDLIKGLIFVAAVCGLMNINTSRMYHSIRAQTGIKLFVMYNVLEIIDKCCCSVGQDILDSLVSLPTSLSTFRTLLFCLLTLAYCCVHSFMLVWQTVTLNVAVNSYSNALFTLMLSNQFGEVKSSAFKKFDRESLFQLTCEDIAQRFQLFLVLLVVSMRNILEMGSLWPPWSSLELAKLQQLLGPSAMVLGSMVLVDWLKHAYIVRFNNLRPGTVYHRFLSIFIADYVEHRQLSSAHLMMKRTGLPVFPLAILFVGIFSRFHTFTYASLPVFWLVLLLAKLMLGVALEDYTSKFATSRKRVKVKIGDLDTVTRYSFPNKAWN